jgi:hypothetical protein
MRFARLRFAPVLLPACAAFALSACADEEQRTYEADAEDLSGGDLQVGQRQAGEVPVDVPETEMTMVPPAEAEGAMAEDEAGAE